MADQPTLRAADFTGGIGVNIHLPYTDGNYRFVNNVIADLRYLGVSLVRDMNLNPKIQGQSSYNKLASAGFKFDLVINGNQSLDQTISELTGFAKAHPGAIASVEGPNEINLTPVRYSGLTGAAAANRLQTDLSAALSHPPSLAAVPLYSYTLGSGGKPTEGFTAGTLHPYPQKGLQPLNAIRNTMMLTPAGKPSIISEFGYSTASGVSSGVSEQVQAKGTLNGILDAAQLGIKTTILYELLDAYSDPTNAKLGKHFGLFNVDNSPKLAAVAIHNMMAILDDPDGTAHNFTATTLNYLISGLPDQTSNLLIEKSSGTFEIALWNEPTIWDNKTHSDIASPTMTVDVALGANYASVELFDPLVSDMPVESFHNISHLSVALTDHPLFIQVEPGLSAGKIDWPNDVATTVSNEGSGAAVSAARDHGPSAFVSVAPVDLAAHSFHIV